MKKLITILTLLTCVTLLGWAAETATPAEPGPEDGGLRMRLVVAPRTDAGKEGYKVRVDVLNASERAITIQAGWQNEETGDLKDYIDAATSIECVPAVQRWMGGVMMRLGNVPEPEQPKQVLKPGEVLSVQWQTEGRHLKNRVTNPNDVQNPTFPFPGLYSVHATLNILTNERMVHLRSNEQLVPVGGSRALPKATFGELLQVDADGKSVLLNLGSLQKIEAGDQFEHLSKGGNWKLTITKPSPNFSWGTIEGTLEAKSPPLLSPPVRGAEVTLIMKK
jgi:hypothetical protein